MTKISFWKGNVRERKMDAGSSSPFMAAPRDASESVLAQTSDFATVPWLSLKGIETVARVVSITDGDTVVLVVPLAISGAITLCRVRARIKGIDTCELHAHDPILRAKAKDARDALKSLFLREGETHVPLVDVACHEFDTYGRVLVDLYEHPSGRSVAESLIASGLAFECRDGVRMSEEAQLMHLKNMPQKVENACY